MTYFKATALREDITYVFTEYLWSRKCIVGVIVTVVLLIIIIIVAVVLTSERTNNVPPVTPEPPVSSTPSPNNADYGDIPVVKRSEWGAMQSLDLTEMEERPPEYVIVAHTAGPFCRTRDHCIKVVREIQEDHMWVNHWTDIGYNFLVGGDGRVYEGCQWDIEGAHTYGWNKKSIGISFTGDYRFDKPTRDQIDVFHKLLALGVKQNKLKANYKILAHFQVTSLLSPGENLFNVIKTWKHWSKCPNLSEPQLCPS